MTVNSLLPDVSFPHLVPHSVGTQRQFIGLISDNRTTRFRPVDVDL